MSIWYSLENEKAYSNIHASFRLPVVVCHIFCQMLSRHVVLEKRSDRIFSLLCFFSEKNVFLSLMILRRHRRFASFRSIECNDFFADVTGTTLTNGRNERPCSLALTCVRV